MTDIDALIVPDDLDEALSTLAAKARWNTLPPSYRRNVLRWIAGARTPPTRAKRITAAAENTAEGKRLPQM